MNNSTHADQPGDDLRGDEKQDKAVDSSMTRKELLRLGWAAPAILAIQFPRTVQAQTGPPPQQEEDSEEEENRT